MKFNTTIFFQELLCNQSVPESWARESQENMQGSRNSRWIFILKKVNKAFRFSAQQLERDATNMIRRAENAMRTNWANTNNAFK